jgi:hypothetical protein
MRVFTWVYGAVFALMLLFFVLSIFGVFTDTYIDPGM